MTGKSSKAWEKCALIGPIVRGIADEIWKILGWFTAGHALLYLGKENNEIWVILFGIVLISVGVALLGFSMFSLASQYWLVKKARNLGPLSFGLVATGTLVICIGLSAVVWDAVYSFFSHIAV